MTVRRSVNNSDKTICVDIFERADGTVGFEEYRRDVEDPSGWFPIGGHAEKRFTTVTDAVIAARAAVPWFKGA